MRHRPSPFRHLLGTSPPGVPLPCQRQWAHVWGLELAGDPGLIQPPEPRTQGLSWWCCTPIIRQWPVPGPRHREAKSGGSPVLSRDTASLESSPVLPASAHEVGVASWGLVTTTSARVAGSAPLGVEPAWGAFL